VPIYSGHQYAARNILIPPLLYPVALVSELNIAVKQTNNRMFLSWLLFTTIIIIILLCYCLGARYRKWVAGGMVPIENLREVIKEFIHGKTMVITGGNTGIGFECAKMLYSLGVHVIILCRNEQKAQTAVKRIIDSQNGKMEKCGQIEYMYMDLSDLDSVRECAHKLLARRLNISVLLNNAGQMMPPHDTTKQGFEIQFGVNYLGHFLLVYYLMDNLLKNNARIINTGSIAHGFYWFTNPFRSQYIRYDCIKSSCHNMFKVDLYSQSKWAMMLFTCELQRKIDQTESRATSYSLHPGCVLTDLPRHIPTILMIPTRLTRWFWLKKPFEGAQTSIYLCIMPDIERYKGKYFADCKIKRATKATYIDANAQELWSKTEELLKDYL
jgi:retinol dehydrogenase-12